MLLFNVD